ncbi:MAG: GGDEF domain-containing protein [Pseudomonadota bacterium]
MKKSMEAYRQADIKPKRLELYPVMIDNLEQLNEPVQALGLMREYLALTEELGSADAQTRIAELQTAFDLEQKDRELAQSESERLARENELLALQAEQEQQRLIRWGLFGGILVLVLFLMLVLRLLRLRTRANRLLAEKNAEIERQRASLSETNAQLQQHSIEDELTGIGNRRAIRQMIDSSLPAAFTQRPALLIVIDLDRFKGINDRFGHQTGDSILARFGAVLSQIAGPDDVVARWGGEEFLWLIAGADLTSASQYCEQLSQLIAETRFFAPERELAITCSMGAAKLDFSTHEAQMAFDLALKVADAALYEAKSEGRNRWAGFARRSEDRNVYTGTLDIPDLVARGELKRMGIDP